MRHALFLGSLTGVCAALCGCVGRDEPSRVAQVSAAGSPQAEVVDLSRFFPDADGTFVLVDGRSGRTIWYNPQRARRRFVPASTFKIPNSLIAIETGVAGGPEHLIAYDAAAAPAQPWWPAAWSRDQTMRTAIRDSVVWYYQELARQIGPRRMQAYLDRFDYGNRVISGGVDVFWLRGGLRISPVEQVAFLRRFYFGQLGVSDRTTAIVKDLITLEETPDYRISGKTGTAELTPTRELGWLVGYIERGDAVWFYALNMEGERVWEDWPPSRRLELVRTILRELRIIQGQAS